MQATKESLYLGLNQAQAGKRIGDVGSAVQVVYGIIGLWSCSGISGAWCR